MDHNYCSGMLRLLCTINGSAEMNKKSKINDDMQREAVAVNIAG